MRKYITRREFLKLLSLQAGGVFFGSLLSACKGIVPEETGPVFMEIPTTKKADPVGADLIALELTAAPGEVDILPGGATRVWQYTGTLLQGDSTNLVQLSGSYLGPILRARRGQRIRIHFKNQIPDETIIHWHGLFVPETMDGHPRFAVPEGGVYEYEFPILNRAGTYWYHPHPHGRTGPQVYYGLAGLFIVSDEEEAKLGLPEGEFDLPLVIQDRTLDGDNQWVYNPNPMTGMFGEQVLVNGQSDYGLTIRPAAYRLRLLNGSNARVYKLAWDDQAPFTVIASDGGLLKKPLELPYLTMAPGERVDLWADFSQHSAGSMVKLSSLPFVLETGGMMGGLDLNSSPLDILTVHIEGKPIASKPLANVLSDPGFLHERDVDGEDRRVQLSMQHMTGTLNGRTFEMGAAAKDENVRLGNVVRWEFTNISGGMGMMGGMLQPHPMHIHGVQFQVLFRQVNRSTRQIANQLNEGFVDEGWKDTVLVLPGETVRVLVKFEHHAGMFLYHCHNLEHEDGGMMRNFRIEA